MSFEKAVEARPKARDKGTLFIMRMIKMRDTRQKYDKNDHSPFECQEGDDCAVCDILYDASEHDQYYEFAMQQEGQNYE